MPNDPFEAWMLPMEAGWRAGEAWLAAMGGVMAGAVPSHERQPPGWTSRGEVSLDLPTMRLRHFARVAGRHGRKAMPVLIVAPYALHAASIADLAPGHSVVERLAGCGVGDLWATDWKCATPAMAGFSIDTYLAELSVAVDDLGGRADLVGLCQGGWLSLVFAARFPGKVGRLVLAGAPVDFGAPGSPLADAVRSTPQALFDKLVEAGGGRALATHLLGLWGTQRLSPEALRAMLQVTRAPEADLEALVQDWNLWAVDLPGPYFLEVADRLFRHNQLAEGAFTALGRTVDLASVTAPIRLLVGRRDTVSPPGQALAVRHLVGTPARDIAVEEADCDHLQLFLGAESLAGPWTRIGRWLAGG